MTRSALPTSTALLSLLLGLSACSRDTVRTYPVAKDPAAAAATPIAPTAPTASPASPPPAGGNTAAAADAAMRNTAVTVATGPALIWDAPASWSAGPERPMRKATLLIADPAGGPSAELAVTAFPGDVGGTLANVNRWRQQLGLPPIAEAQLGSALQHLHVGALHVDVVELLAPAAASPGTSPQRVLGAMAPHAGSTWFFKLTGPDALVAAERERFLALVRSIRPAN